MIYFKNGQRVYSRTLRIFHKKGTGLMKREFFLGAVIILAGALQAQTLRGAITDAVTGKPLCGAAVTLVELSRTCTTDSAGRFLADSLCSGTYTVKITAPQYLRLTRRVFIASPKGAGISDIEFNAGLYNISSAADTSRGTISITYLFPGHDDVEFVIQNSAGTTIRRMYDRSRAGRVRSVSWNGKDNNGNFVPAGRYSCRVSSGRLVMIRTLVWKGPEEVVPGNITAPAALPENPMQAAETPVQAAPVPVQAVETPAVPPAQGVQEIETPKEPAE
jgi:hypothetical protein